MAGRSFVSPVSRSFARKWKWYRSPFWFDVGGARQRWRPRPSAIGPRCSRTGTRGSWWRRGRTRSRSMELPLFFSVPWIVRQREAPITNWRAGWGVEASFYSSDSFPLGWSVRWGLGCVIPYAGTNCYHCTVCNVLQKFDSKVCASL